MRDIRIAAAQFEAHDSDKAYNLARIRELTRRAVDQGAEIVSFHEMCVPGYTWLQGLSREQMARIAEPVPDGPSVRALVQIAREFSTVLMAGLLELEDDRFYNCYVTVSPEGYVTKFRKLHPFISRHLSPGEGYNVIDLLGCKIGFLICYDNNLVENPRATTLLGAEIIIAPHVTGGLPSAMPGRGTIDRPLWDNRLRAPARLRLEFDGRKGREWIMRWLPARAYENGVYYVFSNAIGWDYDSVKPGLSMVLDPHGDVISECRVLGDDVTVALLTAEKLQCASGRRYIKARRPGLYGKLVEPQVSETVPGWLARQRSSETGR